ncbi:roadblock/LC7 domain-containing protein [Streptomyces sp. SID5473]|uniref:Dynein regulation protein LC7 n=2 Tax=Streptomyces TaxID=1883 RepID=A0A7G3UM94_STRT9|nr:dynein regulation protein LC7 [Streptomyces tsukubensis]MYS64064.1 roadblock/LC7 domain-containing protein [Streptomyces sp. SID5473]QKM71406.1 dynein regulation protein LC7 [Streptomyces tsukubensis NRRL18488]TAI45511.1 roadblock/LC7 domain-containing protein [Streptomyces tsukubensis]
MLEDIVRNVPKARHAVLLSADGLPRGATEGLPAKDVRTISAAMAGMQSLSRAIAHFAGDADDRRWSQTIIEFSHGWIFLIGAGQGAYLAAAAAPEVDMQQISFRMHRLVARLGDNLTSPPRVEAGRAGAGGPVRDRQTDAFPGGFTLTALDEAVADVHGARHAVLLGADGLPRGATSGLGRDLADTISAAMTGINAYSRVTAPFAGDLPDAEWRQTVIEFEHGWIFLIAAGNGTFLAAAADRDADIEEFSTRLHAVAPRLNAEPVRAGGADA